MTGSGTGSGGQLRSRQRSLRLEGLLSAPHPTVESVRRPVLAGQFRSFAKGGFGAVQRMRSTHSRMPHERRLQHDQRHRPGHQHGGEQHQPDQLRRFDEDPRPPFRKKTLSEASSGNAVPPTWMLRSRAYRRQRYTEDASNVVDVDPGQRGQPSRSVLDLDLTTRLSGRKLGGVHVGVSNAGAHCPNQLVELPG